MTKKQAHAARVSASKRKEVRSEVGLVIMYIIIPATYADER